ncbi:MAG: DUF2970 domain-containing protein [Proteobacteria bacterium]|nr:DUF2970 domain-containing protein [Pseudomonadota bacterium]
MVIKSFMRMWLKRILYSLMGVRDKSELSDELENFSLKKFILFFIVLNLAFISLVLIIINFFI